MGVRSPLLSRLRARFGAPRGPRIGVPDRPTEEDVRGAYRLLLGREPDPEGFRHWCERLDGMSRDDLVFDFLRSAEFRRKVAERRGRVVEFSEPPRPAPRLAPLVSQLATQAQVDSRAYWRWCEEIGDEPTYHRKQWEYVFLLQALDQERMLRPGRRGLGFGVGREPVPSVLARHGCDLVVTDLDPDAARSAGWSGTQQHARSAEELHRPDLCELEVFRERVRFRVEDMTAISPDLRAGQFDFVWSLCAFEHLGSLEAGLRFVKDAMACVKPGGVAVHTTEYNVASDDETIARGGTVLYRRRDIEGVAAELRAMGYEIELNLHPGDGPLDRFVDLPPYRSDVHLKIQLGKYAATSLGLLVRRPAIAGAAP